MTRRSKFIRPRLGPECLETLMKVVRHTKDLLLLEIVIEMMMEANIASTGVARDRRVHTEWKCQISNQLRADAMP